MCHPKHTRGKQLRIGDTIEVWWGNGRDTLTALRPYNGPLSHLWNRYVGGARLADFAISKVGMTIEPQVMFNVLHRHELKSRTHRQVGAAWRLPKPSRQPLTR